MKIFLAVPLVALYQSKRALVNSVNGIVRSTRAENPRELTIAKLFFSLLVPCMNRTLILNSETEKAGIRWIVKCIQPVVI